MTNLSATTAETVKPTITMTHSYYQFRHIHNILVQISFPYIFIVVGVGLVTNTSTVILLSKGSVTRNLRHKWTLNALALSDLIHNIALLIRAIHDIIHGKIQYLCIIISFLSHLAELLSACYTVLFTVQRYMAVRYPLQAAVQERSSPIVPLLLIFGFSVTFCTMLSISNKYRSCHEELKLNWFIADALFSFVIPFSLILVFNVLIVNLIRKHARAPFIDPPTPSKSSKHHKNDVHYIFKRKRQSKESFSLTCSYGVASTVNGTLSEAEIGRKLHTVYSSSEKKKINVSIRSQTPRSLSTRSNETRCQSSILSSPAFSVKRINLDGLSNTLSLSNLNLSVKSDKDNGTPKRPSACSKACSLRRLSQLSKDVDFISNKSSQTIQSIRVTRMLVLVSTCFLVLNAPAHLFVIGLKVYTNTINSRVSNEYGELSGFQQMKNFTNSQMKNYFIIQSQNQMSGNNNQLQHGIDLVDDEKWVHWFYLVISLTQLISYASYSINFFLYSFSGVAFRTSLKQILHRM